ncbi:uncharacterized protein [Aristolochia californica]|uniref:uncharacterized protein n=1 Tax=Aristolochia californica TaxID=171875 RepID=UPI0035E1DAB6
MPAAVPSCFRGHGGDRGLPNLTTCFYNTPHGVAALTWSRTLVGHSLRADLHLDDHLVTYHLPIKPWFFWKKHGSKVFLLENKIRVQFSWDLGRAKFLSGPEPVSGFFFAVSVDGETTLIAEDRYSREDAYTGTRAARLVLRQEQVFADKVHTTKARFGGVTHEVSINCHTCEDPSLTFFIDRKKVLQVKRLKWKFRGNERIEFDGVQIQVSWDVYNWLFDNNSYENKYAVFMLRFEEEGEDGENWEEKCDANKVIPLCRPWEREKKMKKKSNNKSLLKTRSSSSSSSVSSAGSSSVMEWTSSEDDELQSTGGFSLLIHARRN